MEFSIFILQQQILESCPWIYFIFIAYGWQEYQISSWNSVLKKDSNEPRNTPYDKLSLRELPPARIELDQVEQVM